MPVTDRMPFVAIREAFISPAPSCHSIQPTTMSNNHRSCQERILAYNEAGVAAVHLGALRCAWDLFKGALEIRRSQGVDDNIDTSVSFEDCLKDNKFVQRAEEKLRAFEYKGLTEQPLKQTHTSSSFEYPNRTVSSEDEDALFLSSDPFSLAVVQGLPEPMATRLTVVVLIFNMALTTQLMNRSSRAVLSFYELASRTLHPVRYTPLELALINNMGVWCAENHEVESAQRCMQHLFVILGSSRDQQAYSEYVANMTWILNPPALLASPAA